MTFQYSLHWHCLYHQWGWRYFHLCPRRLTTEDTVIWAPLPRSLWSGPVTGRQGGDWREGRETSGHFLPGVVSFRGHSSQRPRPYVTTLRAFCAPCSSSHAAQKSCFLSLRPQSQGGNGFLLLLLISECLTISCLSPNPPLSFGRHLSVVALVCWNTKIHNSCYFFIRETDRNSFRLCRPSDLCCNYSILPPQGENRHKEYTNEWVWLGSNKTGFTKQGPGQSSPGAMAADPSTKEIAPSARYQGQRSFSQFGFSLFLWGFCHAEF